MVDPVREQAGRDTANLNLFGLKLVCIDHVTGAQPKKIAEAVAANLRCGAG